MSTGNWARYVDKIRLQVWTKVNQYRSLRVLPNRLTPIYSKNHYEEENYLKIKTVIFKYITPPYSNSPVCRYVGTLGTQVREYIGSFSMWLITSYVT